MHGDERNFCVALVTLDPDALTDWANHNGHDGKSYAELVEGPGAREGGRRTTSSSSTGRLNRWETIKKWIILDHDLTVESGELTPSMKVKRKVVEDNYKAEIDKLYA